MVGIVSQASLFFPSPHPPPDSGSDDGNYYTHLGAASDPDQLKTMLEQRYGVLLCLQYLGL